MHALLWFHWQAWIDLRLIESDGTGWSSCSRVLYLAHFIHSSLSVFQNIQKLRSQTLHPYKINFYWVLYVYQIYSSVVWVLSRVNIYHCGESSFLLLNTESCSHAVTQQWLAVIHSIPWAAGYILSGLEQHVYAIIYCIITLTNHSYFRLCFH